MSGVFLPYVDFFGIAAGTDVMAIYIAGSMVLFAALNLVLGTRLLNLPSYGSAASVFRRRKRKQKAESKRKAK